LAFDGLHQTAEYVLSHSDPQPSPDRARRSAAPALRGETIRSIDASGLAPGVLQY
jgi:hypothetical protein